MTNKTKNQQGGFVKLILLVVLVLLLMKYFHLTFSGVLAYFHLTWPQILGYFKQALDWFKDLFNSVK